MKRLQASADMWSQHEEELSRNQRRREEVDKLLRDKKTARGRMQRIQTALPSLARWKAESDDFAKLKVAPLLAENFAKQLHSALSRLDLSQGRESDAMQELANLQDELANETVPQEILAEADTIQALYLRLGSHRKAAQDR